ncbi:ribbon-helix-helix domain-containing protein [Sphingomonas profundi]|uniref:ribbon-helix-helix domain-containing protein n=1 Tax=Alterirhizorhabdus profundi TaxID=2681549 RepID=UPI0024110061|nr:ribbon-helix-helix domain-containing protein [Sphingomonas profundi]
MAGPVKRSVMIAGHATSISLEPIFWDALAVAAAEERLPLNALVARIDADRIDVARAAAEAPANLASAVRVWLFARCRRDLNRDLRSPGPPD